VDENERRPAPVLVVRNSHAGRRRKAVHRLANGTSLVEILYTLPLAPLARNFDT
jgi:hypothetical protein